MTDTATLALAASIGGFFVQSGIVAWGIWSVRKIAREEVEQVADKMANALEHHNDNPQAHPNHNMTPVIRDLQLQVVQSLAELRAEIRELRKAHDEAMKGNMCLYQSRGGGRS